MGGVVQAMAYDPDGVRIQKSTNGDVTDYLVDSNRDYAQVLYERSATSELNYTFGTDLVGLSTRVDNFTYHTDALGSTRLLTNVEGDVADDVRYDAWGEKLSGGDVVENQYLYTGEQFDGGLGKTYLRARYYNAGVGRFLNQDSWAGFERLPISLNKYVYAAQDPVFFTDPSGQIFTLTGQQVALAGAAALLTVAAANSTQFGSTSNSRSGVTGIGNGFQNFIDTLSELRIFRTRYLVSSSSKGDGKSNVIPFPAKPKEEIDDDARIAIVQELMSNSSSIFLVLIFDREQLPTVMAVVF